VQPAERPLKLLVLRAVVHLADRQLPRPPLLLARRGRGRGRDKGNRVRGCGGKGKRDRGGEGEGVEAKRD
jgi:hypothetical protein